MATEDGRIRGALAGNLRLNEISAALQRLLDAGWSTTDIVTLSQLVAFLSFQIRVVAGLHALAGASARESAGTDLTQIFTGALASGAV